MDQADSERRAAARAALAELPERGTIGLGTGRTAHFFVEAVAERVREGTAWTGVPTSKQTRALAASLGIPLLDDDGPWDIAVTVDGADEVSESLDLVKGGGGAQTREKIVSHASRRNIIVVDSAKVSRKLGERRAVPVEILAFGAKTTLRHLEAFGPTTTRAVASDAGNLLADIATGPIDDPAALDRALRAIPGVVETGLFVGRADIVLVAEASGVRRLARKG